MATSSWLRLAMSTQAGAGIVEKRVTQDTATPAAQGHGAIITISPTDITHPAGWCPRRRATSDKFFTVTRPRRASFAYPMAPRQAALRPWCDGVPGGATGANISPAPSWCRGNVKTVASH